jgi:hypothetical protein
MEMPVVALDDSNASMRLVIFSSPVFVPCAGTQGGLLLTLKLHRTRANRNIRLIPRRPQLCRNGRLASKEIWCEGRQSTPSRRSAQAPSLRFSRTSATWGDLPAVLAIYNEVIANSTAVYALEPASLDERRAWFASRRATNFPVLVAVAPGGDVLGFASFGEWRVASPGYRYTVEHSVHAA